MSRAPFLQQQDQALEMLAYLDGKVSRAEVANTLKTSVGWLFAVTRRQTVMDQQHFGRLEKLYKKVKKKEEASHPTPSPPPEPPEPMPASGLPGDLTTAARHQCAHRKDPVRYCQRKAQHPLLCWNPDDKWYEPSVEAGPQSDPEPIPEKPRPRRRSSSPPPQQTGWFADMEAYEKALDGVRVSIEEAYEALATVTKSAPLVVGKGLADHGEKLFDLLGGLDEVKADLSP